MSLSIPGRISAVHGQTFVVLTDAAEQTVPAAAKLPYAPVVGDFVSICDGWIDEILPRRSSITRVAPGTAHTIQTLAANLDIFFIVSGLDQDFNLRRLERYLVMAHASGARPVIVLTKADLARDAESKRARVHRIADGCPVILSSSMDGEGAEQMRRMLAPTATTPELTAALLGSSGAGKSTLVNLLLGSATQAVNEVRANDGRGRHTTTHRQMFRIPGGGWLIDQPGIREVQITADQLEVQGAFGEIAELAQACRFRDCRHETEPGCAVRNAVDPARLRSFSKLTREAQRHEEEFNAAAHHSRKSKLKAIHKAIRVYKQK